MKRVLLVLTAIMLVFAVAGCNSNGAPTTVNDKLQPGPGPGGEEGGDEGGEEVVVKVLEVTYGENWSGIDLMDTFFHFAADDNITAKGKIVAVAGATPEFVFNDKPGDWGTPVFQKTSIAAGAEWEFDKPLTAGMIANIADGSPAAIRIAGNNVTANSLIVVFEQIKVTRGADVLLDLAEHLQTFEIDASDMNTILPGAKGFQKAGNVTVKVIAK